MKYSLIFFGSFGNFSVNILNTLKMSNDYQLAAVVTTPPSPKGRHLMLTKNEVHIYAESHHIPVITSLSLHSSTLQLSRSDFIVVAGYGKLIPKAWLDLPKIMAVNMHPSLLPQYAGRCPAEWAILNGEKETGVTLIQMTEKFDSGPIIAQQKIPIDQSDTRLTLYTKLFDLGAKMLIDTLPKIAAGKIVPTPQILDSHPYPLFYSRQITRQDGFVEYEKFVALLSTSSLVLSTKLRAFCGWPGVWTINPSGKRIKLISLTPKIIIQEEGKIPVEFIR